MQDIQKSTQMNVVTEVSQGALSWFPKSQSLAAVTASQICWWYHPLLKNPPYYPHETVSSANGPIKWRTWAVTRLVTHWAWHKIPINCALDNETSPFIGATISRQRHRCQKACHWHKATWTHHNSAMSTWSRLTIYLLKRTLFCT